MDNHASVTCSNAIGQLFCLQIITPVVSCRCKSSKRLFQPKRQCC